MGRTAGKKYFDTPKSQSPDSSKIFVFIRR
jgi:hypothetical protein